MPADDPGATVRLEPDGDTAELVLDRPDARNAVTTTMAGELADALARLEEGGFRALVVRGEGRAFCAGRDLSEIDPETEDSEAVLAERLNPVIRRLGALPLPTFAAVHGAALGFGFGLAMACDVAYAADDARLGSPFARIGAVLDSGGHAALYQRVGPHRALELIYTGRLLSGREAAEWGLVNRSVAGAQLFAVTRETARAVAAGPTSAFAASKRIIAGLAERGLDPETALAEEAAAQGEAARGPDFAEGVAAFLEKRTPRFTGR